MTPSEYAERYRNLTVRYNGQSRKVRVEMYRLGQPHNEQQVLWQALKEHFRANKKKNPNYSITLRYDQGQRDFYSLEAMLWPVVNPFWGKGSPEDCQTSLAVAVMLGRTTMANLQDYANSYMGLDCNGFVGNYIWRERLGNPWHKHPEQTEIPAPAANIGSIFQWAEKRAGLSGTTVDKIDDIDSKKSYILALVDSKFKVMPGGPGNPAGHIVITQPGRFMAKSFVSDSMGFYDLRMANQNAYGHPALWAVESTGPQLHVGLKESWYAIRPVLNAKKQPVPGVFSIYRGSKAMANNFRIVPVN